MSKTSSARVSLEGGKLESPHTQNNDAIVRPSEDFTVSINTISQSLYADYRSHYKAGEYGNDHFVLMSKIGLGNPRKPTVKMHQLKRISSINADMTSIWGENVENVDDYNAKGGESQRLYLSFHSFCQGLGTPFDPVQQTFDDILNLTGSIFPALAPFTTTGRAVIKGVNNLFRKLIHIQSEIKEVEFSLYPASTSRPPIAGEAPLQLGAYVLFFEETDIDGLALDAAGIVRSNSSDRIPPYVVVNVKPGKMLAPDQISTDEAVRFLDTFQNSYGYPLVGEGEASLRFFDAMKEFGLAQRRDRYWRRYFELKAKGSRTEQEETKLDQLLEALTTAYPDLKF